MATTVQDMRAQAILLRKQRTHRPKSRVREWILFGLLTVIICLLPLPQKESRISMQAAFRPNDPRMLPTCSTQEESCPSVWSVTGDNRLRYKMIRFMSGTASTVKTLAVPEPLLDRWPFPDCASADGNDPACLEGSLKRLALVGLAPSMSPIPKGSGLQEGSDRRVATMMLESILWDGGVIPLRSTILNAAGTETALMVLSTLTGPNAAYATQEKEPVYGLSRVGPRHDKKGSDASSLADFLFTGDGLATPGDLLICTVDEAEGQAAGVGRVRPTCRQWFTIPEVGMLVRLTYDRSLLPEWQAIKKGAKTRVFEFLLSTVTPSNDDD